MSELPYEQLLNEAYQEDVEVYEEALSKRIKGLYADNVIWLNKGLSTNDKTCTLAEELGHYHTTSGNILDQSDVYNRKQEKQARNWAYKKVVPLYKIIEAFNDGVQSKYELADFLNITEEFLLEALNRYKEEYGVSKIIDEYIIFFEPLAVAELYERG